MKFSRSSLKFKIPTIFFVLILTVSITGFIYIYVTHSNNLSMKVKNKVELFSDSFKEQLKVQERDLKMSMDLLLKNDEIVKLFAERTSKATQEIADMIANIQVEMYNAVNTINNGTKEAEEGKELANQAGKAIAKITSSIDNTVGMINQVAAASEEQSSTFGQISTNIEMISKVTTEATMGVEQMAKASEDLNRLTDTLQNLISHFHIINSRKVKNVNFENVGEQWNLENQNVV